MSAAFKSITLVSVTGLPDARGAALALRHSLDQMPGARALLCSPHAPDALGSGIAHLPIAPLNYHEYGWFMLFALWRVVHTEFALVVQDDGWVLDAANWHAEYLNYDFLGAPIHLAKVSTPDGTAWQNRFEWTRALSQPGCVVTPVQNGGFSLRSQRLMRALSEHPHIQVRVPPPDAVGGEPLRMHWQHNALMEDVQLTGLLRPELEAAGIRFAPLATARAFAIEHAGPVLHDGLDLMTVFGHHSRWRRLASLAPLTVRSTLRPAEVDQHYGERQVLQMFARRGYAVEFGA